MNQIPTTQNLETQLKTLRARRQTYFNATRLLIIQLVLTVLVPVIGAVSAIIFPDVRPFVAIVALLILIIDIAFLDRPHKQHLKTAAKLQEQFDCTVLALPWDGFVVGSKIDPEIIHKDSAAYLARGKNDDGLRNWYPVAVGAAPIHLARIICQRTNLWYDAGLRRIYARIVLALPIVLVTLLTILGLALKLTLTGFVISVLAPAAPIVGWSLREYFRQQDTADQLDEIRKHAMALWTRAKDGLCSPDECAVKSREFQNAIYGHRARSPLPVPFVYKIVRNNFEEQMNEGAADLLREIGIVPGDNSKIS